MSLKIVKSLLLFAVFYLAIFTVTIISTEFYAVHAMTDNCTSYMHDEKSATLMYVSGPVGGGYTPCGGDGVGGGHPMGNQSV